MTTQYFQNFPLVLYRSKLARNITLRVRLCECVQKFRRHFYPYIVQDGERADMIAYDYYGSSEYVWLIYGANNIVDPYHQWYLSSREFISYIEQKYGSVAVAQNQIVYYKNDDDQLITPDSYTLASTVEDSTSVVGFSPYYAYDYEFDINETRRSISLLDEKYKVQAERELRQLLSTG